MGLSLGLFQTFSVIVHDSHGQENETFRASQIISAIFQPIVWFQKWLIFQKNPPRLVMYKNSKQYFRVKSFFRLYQVSILS